MSWPLCPLRCHTDLVRHPRLTKAETLYVLTCLALLLLAALDGGDHLWPYIALTAALAPAGVFGVDLLALTAQSLPAVLAAEFMAAGVLGLAGVNVALGRSRRGWCRRRRSVTV